MADSAQDQSALPDGVVEILIPVMSGRAPPGPRRKVCQRHHLGWTKINREMKLEWPGPTLRCRDRNGHAWAVVCGPEDLLNQALDDIRDCLLDGLRAAAITAIVLTPAASIPIFKAAVIACLLKKLGERAKECSLEIEITSETTDWGRC